ncbi:metal dependent phosphohydrolase [Candidatus Koribacter versatilis Ellin345]|uniref:Metal dependent phosphohydrolase n=1 Tax=Koribacter versatilis (strain Ellin345) TaxID=204669 RepID=Q1ILB4_KORVE|nr:HD domain-containing phosphohydrolase [Candidatus Koribacter versatilis]ABF42336.1 metal dependent phosphohydrolase [Candidatus Koribacter versatilis Ellin345]
MHDSEIATGLKRFLPQRIPILYLILGALLAVSVIPMYFYARVVAINRDRLKTNEMLLQNTVTRSLADDASQRQRNLQMMLQNLSTAVQINSGGNLDDATIASPEMRALLENFVSSGGDVAYATILNSEAKGVTAGRIVPDEFLQREMKKGFDLAKEGQAYTGQALQVGTGDDTHTVMLVTRPIMIGDTFIGLISAVVDLDYLLNRLQEVSHGGLIAYVVDSHGRLIAGAERSYAIGQDMTSIELVKAFVEEGGRLAATHEFNMSVEGKKIEMLGTYSPVQSLNWAVIAQKQTSEAYQGIYEMQRSARLLAILAVLMSLVISIWAARRITTPLDVLTQSSRAIARGDFSRRVELVTRTEIGELANTFNSMTDEIERHIEDLKRAAEENRQLFLSSIQMLAGAVDEKDPYTRGHSDRVTRYSVLIATEMGLSTEEVEKIRISAQLHDVGKIGIEDRILKKPGALTPEEFEIMKTHTTKGAIILRPVTQLADMIPGIELHHESLDGRGYPYGLKGDQIPLMPRIIMVADTFDAMTTNRPYQAAADPEYVVRIINSLANTKFDPRCVAAFTAVFQRGQVHVKRDVPMPAVAMAAAAPLPVAGHREAALLVDTERI